VRRPGVGLDLCMACEALLVAEFPRVDMKINQVLLRRKTAEAHNITIQAIKAFFIASSFMNVEIHLSYPVSCLSENINVFDLLFQEGKSGWGGKYNQMVLLE
jgi:hypothetical protein